MSKKKNVKGTGRKVTTFKSNPKKQKKTASVPVVDTPAVVAEETPVAETAPVEETPVVETVPTLVKEKQKRTYTRKPGPRGKRSAGTDFDVARAVLSEELSGLELVSREALQTACDSRAGRRITLQTTLWSVPHTYRDGTIRPAILLPSGLGPKSGVFKNPAFVRAEVSV